MKYENEKHNILWSLYSSNAAGAANSTPNNINNNNNNVMHFIC